MFARGTRARRLAATVLPPLLFAILVLGAWQLYTVVGDIKESTLPPPTDIAKAIWDERSLLIENAWVTIKEILIGFVFAIILGVGLAVLIRSSRTIERAVYPWLVVSQMVPIPAIAPLLIIWFGFEMQPKVIVIVLVSFFPIAVNTIDGLRAAEPELLNLLKTLKANAWQRFMHVTLPGLKTTLVISAVLQSIWALKVFDLIYVLTKGSPADSTVLLNYLSWRETFSNLDIGYGAAIANVLFALMFLLALAYIRVLRPRERKSTG